MGKGDLLSHIGKATILASKVEQFLLPNIRRAHFLSGVLLTLGRPPQLVRLPAGGTLVLGRRWAPAICAPALRCVAMLDRVGHAAARLDARVRVRRLGHGRLCAVVVLGQGVPVLASVRGAVPNGERCLAAEIVDRTRHNADNVHHDGRDHLCVLVVAVREKKREGERGKIVRGNGMGVHGAASLFFSFSWKLTFCFRAPVQVRKAAQ